MGYTPSVLVIGGGATGTGVARDLAIRGLDVTLVERGTLAAGTSGSMHALLHSGARYAVDDGETAQRCRRESQILRDIGGHLLDDVGGLFVALPADDEEYFETKRAACERAEVPVEELSGQEAREREPTLAPAVDRALAVPDAVIDPAGLCVANARSAVRHGAAVHTGWQVVAIETADGSVDSVRLRNRDPSVSALDGEGSALLEPDYVVNAAGPWAGEVAGMAGLDVPIRHSRGAMVTVERAGLETVVNRCRPRTEGDIAVPFGGTAVLGTTDREVDGPAADVADDEDAAAAEVAFLLAELGELVPPLTRARPYRADWGVRALPVAEEGDDTTDVERSETVIDHASADVWGMTTVFGGKLTLHRHIAELVADQVCGKFGIDRPCQTAEMDLPTGVADVGPLNREPGRTTGLAATNPVLCEDRGVTHRQVRDVLDEDELPPGEGLRPVRQRTGAATGACQGGRCGHRLAVELYSNADARTVARALDEFAAERWAGHRFAWWGDGLRTAADTYRLHGEVLNRNGNPGPTTTIDYAAYDAGRPAGRGLGDDPGGAGDA